MKKTILKALTAILILSVLSVMCIACDEKDDTLTIGEDVVVIISDVNNTQREDTATFDTDESTQDGIIMESNLDGNRDRKLKEDDIAQISIADIFTQEKIYIAEPVLLENIQYFENIRWMVNYPEATIGTMSMNFAIPSAQRYYKVKYERYANDYQKPLKPTDYELLGNDDTSFFNILKPEWKHKNYYLPIVAFGSIPEKATKVTNTEVDSIEGKYIPNDPESEFIYFILTEVLEPEKYIGYVGLTYNEIGRHFITYDASTAIFTSDNTFGEELIEELAEVFKEMDELEDMYDSIPKPINRIYSVTPYTNDNFALQIVSYGNNNEKMLLKTNQYELECIPMELVMNTGIKCNLMSSAKNLYENSKMSSVSISIENVENFEILERQTKWEEIDGEMSMWYKIRTEKGDEGWVWGRDISLDDDEYSRGQFLKRHRGW